MARTLAAEDDKVARRAEISRQAAGAAPDNRDFTTVTVWGLVDKSPSRTSLHAAPAGLFRQPKAPYFVVPASRKFCPLML